MAANTQDFLLKIARDFFNFLRPVLNFNIKIKHPYTNRPFCLNFVNHKGYWYHGKRIEQNETLWILENIQSKHKILEVGAHIGFLTQIFEHITYNEYPSVLAIEPSPNNLYFLKKNTTTSTKIVEAAVSNKTSEIPLYIDNNGGFMNSLDPDFISQSDISSTQRRQVSTIPLLVKAKTIDLICKENNFQPDFIKIDVEGFELEALEGASESLKAASMIMIEVTKNKELCLKILSDSGFIFPESQIKALSQQSSAPINLLGQKRLL